LKPERIPMRAPPRLRSFGRRLRFFWAMGAI
jgi:hypothetical protein